MKSMVRNMSKTENRAKDAGRTNTFGKVTSTNMGGKLANVETNSGSEIRELTITLPYGMSSSAIDGMVVQVVLNSANDGTVVGIIDSKRPVVSPGQTILYDKSGSRIEMLGDGTIRLVPGNGGTPLIIG